MAYDGAGAGMIGTAVPATGVGVLDKCVAILSAIRRGAGTAAEVCTLTRLPRPTVHRLLTALAAHGLVARSPSGALTIGPLAGVLASVSAGDTLVGSAVPFLTRLRDETGENAQLFRTKGNLRVCVATVDRKHGLRDSVAAGDTLPLTAGSAAQVLLAWAGERDEALLRDARFTWADLEEVRRRGWAESVGQRESGLASVSAPVRHRGQVVAALCVSGPVHRLGDHPGARLAGTVTAAAEALGQHLAAVLGDDQRGG